MKANERTIENAKKIVSCLNQLKIKNERYYYLKDIIDELKQMQCPYASMLVPYLKRQSSIVKKGDYYFFVNQKPFDYYNFICVVDRIKMINNKHKSMKTHLYPKSTEVSVKKYSKWTKFWSKLLFKIEI